MPTIFEYKTSRGITEGFTRIDKWMTLKAGDVIRSRRSNKPRKIIDTRNGCITLLKISGLGTTVYVPCDRHFFKI